MPRGYLRKGTPTEAADPLLGGCEKALSESSWELSLGGLAEHGRKQGNKTRREHARQRGRSQREHSGTESPWGKGVAEPAGAGTGELVALSPARKPVFFSAAGPPPRGGGATAAAWADGASRRRPRCSSGRPRAARPAQEGPRPRRLRGGGVPAAAGLWILRDDDR